MLSKILSLSRKLIDIESTSKSLVELKRALDLALSYLKEYNIFYYKGEAPSALITNSKNELEKFKIILNAHLDVVPGKKSQFKSIVKGKRLYGRGAYDMKAAAAVEILVFKELAKKVNYPLGLQLVTDEEVGGFKGTKYHIDRGVKAEFVIAGEPTDLDINNQAKGVIWLKVKANGKNAHGAYPWEGENAIWKIHDFLNSLFKKYPLPRKEVWQTTVNLARIETSNETFNKVPDYAEAWLDIRYIPEDEYIIVQDIKNLLTKDLKVEILLKEPFHYTDEKNLFVKKLLNSAKKIRGKQSLLIFKHGASDIRHYTKIGCEGVTFGPIGYGQHTDDEWVDIESLSDFYQILKDFLLSI